MTKHLRGLALILAGVMLLTLCAVANGTSAPAGLLIPPSNALITYSLTAGGTSVAALFLPVVETFGMDPVQFGLILVYNLCIGNITPPVGNTLFVAIKVGRTSLSKVLPYMLGYYVMILLGLLLVTYVPAISLGLPRMAGLI